MKFPPKNNMYCIAGSGYGGECRVASLQLQSHLLHRLFEGT